MKRYVGLILFYLNKWISPNFKNEYYLANRKEFTQNTVPILILSLAVGVCLGGLVIIPTEPLMTVEELTWYQLGIMGVSFLWILYLFRKRDTNPKTGKATTIRVETSFIFVMGYFFPVSIAMSYYIHGYVKTFSSVADIPYKFEIASVIQLGLLISVMIVNKLIQKYYIPIDAGMSNFFKYLEYKFAKKKTKSNSQTLKPIEKDFLLIPKSKEEKELSKIID